MSTRKRQSGSSLLEVLVSILLMSFGMLALAGMQAYSVAAQKNAANRAIASMLANELAELVRLNQTAFAAGNYDVSVLTNANPPARSPCVFPNCTTTTLAAADITDFQNLVRRQLTDGGVVLTRPAVGGITSTTEASLWIVWNEPSVLNLTQGGTATSTELTADNCPAAAKALAVLPRCFYMKVQL
jgi:type IV pilus assembly protein PilV